ncbi:MAG: hypothetical protein COW44_09960 [Flavobacteriaceae bacterium CG17_big_fil_post_rev_8_21_14_2_50_33_15]|nr:MAG: hypothetical protein COW44_09960 [Flavobacteriaceae bacterium CG17_big_fil_post_rev_8_21_14_2_50_33_15]
MNLDMTHKIYKISFFVVLSVIALIIFGFFYYTLIGVDSGTYLSMAKEFYKGKIYFQEIGTNYNPLAIIIMGIPFLFENEPSYYWHYIIHLLTMISSTIVFYKILCQISKNQNQNLFYSSFFLLGSLFLDGRYILLEPLSVFFQLLVVNLYLKSNHLRQFFLIGIFICLAFLSKQFGLFILAPIGIDILVRKENAIKKIVLIGIGMLIPLIVFYIYLSQIDLSVEQFVYFILGQGNNLDVGTGTGKDFVLLDFIKAPLYFLMQHLYLLLIPILIFKNSKILNNHFYFLSLLVLSSLLVLYFAVYSHYFQYVLPYALLLFVYLVNYNKNKRLEKISFSLFVLSFFVISIISTISFTRKKNQVITQRDGAKIITSYIKPNSEVYLDGISPAYYYICNLQSINLKDISFTFPGYYYPKTIFNNLKDGSYIIIAENRYKLYEQFLKNQTVKEFIVDNKKYYVVNIKKTH